MNVSMLLRVLAVPAVAAVLFCGCSSADWPAFRHDARRTGAQPKKSPLSSPEEVKKLKCLWRFPKAGDPDLCDGFRASPVVYKGRVFIGNGNGYFYALSAETGRQLWQYPPAGSKPLTSQFQCENLSSVGIASTATITKIGGTDAVIFAAPDPSIGTRLGEGRLFALKTRTGEVIWRSPVIARLTGCTEDCTTEFHENLGYSSPLVLGDKVYVGISDHCDNPVQKGRVAAVDLKTGRLVNNFRYCSTHLLEKPADVCDERDKTRGGGVSSSPAGWRDGLYITTGNTRSGQDFKPGTNHGLSLLRLHPATGAVDWKFQPVPWELDADPDWSATPTIMSTSCGLMIVSTQKDGWTHAVKADDGKRLWSFPEASIPFRCGDGTKHADTRYMRSGAVWGDVYVVMNGGENLTTSPTDGYTRLHALNVCEPDATKRLRWMIDVPRTSGNVYSLGNPTITDGIVYVGTDLGALLAIADPATLSKSDPIRRCENPDVPTELCLDVGYDLTEVPKILAIVALTGSMVHTEPALANGRVYVATGGRDEPGYIYMLKPSDEAHQCDVPK